ncbi:MAG: hypothetical protein KAR40_10000 [Candidatus Sabulitectum sp.]|nr:hypothetical protein [Candidatus Sabulitectum sp.]
MKSFIFHDKATAFPYPELCGTTPIEDLIVHLKNSGVTHIFLDSEKDYEGATACDFESARQQLGIGWLAAYSGCITRQSPAELRDLTQTLGADTGISLACSAKPWEHTTILTDGRGFVEKVEENPPPENTETNLCFSNLVWVATDEFDPDLPWGGRASAFLLPGYWKCPNSRENYLLTIHDLMCREVFPWPHLHIPDNGIILNSLIPGNIEIRGTLWVGNNCCIENGCILENCVILDGSTVGANSNLRNCLVMDGARIPRNTVQYDKYLSFPGDDNGRED